MSISTHTELKTAISNWLKRSDLSTYLDDLVTLAEVRIFRDVRNEDTQGSYSESINTSTGGTIAPAGFLGWRNVDVNSGTFRQPLTVTTANQAMQEMDYPQRTGLPKFIWHTGSGAGFAFYPFPDSDYTVSGTYYKKPGTLSSAEYDLFTNNPDLYLFASLAEAAPFLKDDKRVELWEAKYRQIKDAVNAQYTKTRFSGPLHMTARGA